MMKLKFLDESSIYKPGGSIIITGGQESEKTGIVEAESERG